MKKVLCLIDTLGSGGAERQMIGLATFLKLRNYNVDLVCYYNDIFYVDLLQKCDIDPIVIPVRKNKFDKIRKIYQLMSKNKYNVVIAYKDGPALIACILKLLGLNFRLIVSERNTNQNVYRIDKIKFFLYLWADFIVPNSYSQREFIKNNFPSLSNKVKTITNYTDINYFLPSNNYVQNSCLKILTVARVATQKNVLNYLLVVKKLKEQHYNVHFDWYGNAQIGEEYYKEICLSKVKELGIEDYITFYPGTSNIISCYQQCDIFCLPSLYEGFPNVICEAMSCGKPILCSRICDNSYIVQEGVNGLFFNPLDIEEMVNAFKTIFGFSKEYLTKMGEDSRLIAEEIFSKDVFVDKYIDLIEAKL